MLKPLTDSDYIAGLCQYIRMYQTTDHCLYSYW